MSRLTIRSFDDLRQQARQAGPLHLVVVAADDQVALAAAETAADQNMVKVTLIGDSERIQEHIDRGGFKRLAAEALIIFAANTRHAAETAVSLCRKGEADMLLKGRLRSDELLHVVLDKVHGIRTGQQLLSDVLLYEDNTSKQRRLVAITDGGVNVLPNLDGKKQIIQNAVIVMNALGIARPHLALMSATEAVTSSIPSTTEAQALTEWGNKVMQDRCLIYGPLALDNALYESAAKAKGIESPVAGRPDVLVMPNIEAGNILGKAVKYLYGSPCAHVIVGTRVPVLIPSRVESVEDKLNSIALGVLVHHQGQDRRQPHHLQNTARQDSG